jgi:NitT/TauT family transport system permease protein
MNIDHVSPNPAARFMTLRKVAEENWRRARKVGRQYFEYLLIPVSVLLFLGAWHLIILRGRLPDYVLPEPGAVWRRFLDATEGGILWHHASYTLAGALLGLGLGLAFATIVGYILGKSPAMERITSPYVVAAKAIPILGIAPLFIMWFGMGLSSRALIAFTIIFFPMLVNMIVGIRSVSYEERELMRSYSASSWHVFTLLEVPAALPILLAGIRIGIARSMMGAIVAEYLGSQRGLGFLVNLGTGLTDAPLVFVGIFTIVILTTALYGLAVILENVLLAGKRPGTST